MALIFEDSEKVTNKKFKVSKKQKAVFKAMDKLYKPYEDKVEGGHVLKSLASDKAYNKKGEESNQNGEDNSTSTFTIDQAKVQNHRQEKFAPNTIQYQMYGGSVGKKMRDDAIRRARTVNMVSPVDPPKPTDQGSTKPAEVKMETTPKGVKYQLAAHKTPKKVMDESKKIYISEAQVIKLKEI